MRWWRSVPPTPRLQTLAHSDLSVPSSSPLSHIDSLPLFGMDDSVHFLWSPPKNKRRLGFIRLKLCVCACKITEINTGVGLKSDSAVAMMLINHAALTLSFLHPSSMKLI